MTDSSKALVHWRMRKRLMNLDQANSSVLATPQAIKYPYYIYIYMIYHINDMFIKYTEYISHVSDCSAMQFLLKCKEPFEWGKVV